MMTEKKFMLPFVSKKKFQCQEKKPRPPGYQMVGPLDKGGFVVVYSFFHPERTITRT